MSEQYLPQTTPATVVTNKQNSDEPTAHHKKHGDNQQLQVPKSESDSLSSPASNTQLSPRSNMSNDNDNESVSKVENKPKTQNFKRGTWSPQEDERLISLVETIRPLKWVYVAQEMQTRSSKQCRERYHNYLKPSLTKTLISKEEGRKIEDLVAIYGKKWAEISRQLPGRSDNAIKNWWNATVNRRRNSQEQLASSLSTNVGVSTSNKNVDVKKTEQEAKGISKNSPISFAQTTTIDDRRNKSVSSVKSNSSIGSNNSGVSPPQKYNGIQQLIDAGQTAFLSSPTQQNHQLPEPVNIQQQQNSQQQLSESNHANHQPNDHLMYPPPIQVAFSARYAENTPPPHSVSSPLQTHSHHSTTTHVGFSPYPLTPNTRAESRANSLARLSLGHLGVRRSSSVTELMASSPTASPPSTPGLNGSKSLHPSYFGHYSHYPRGQRRDDPASTLFNRIRQNSEIRRNSGSIDATSLSQYSLETQMRSQSRDSSSSLYPPPNVHKGSISPKPLLPNLNDSVLRKTSVPMIVEDNRALPSIGSTPQVQTNSNETNESQSTSNSQRLSISTLTN